MNLLFRHSQGKADFHPRGFWFISNVWDKRPLDKELRLPHDHPNLELLTMMTYLTAPEALQQPRNTYRYLVAVISCECVEQQGYAVPKDFQILDVVVTEPVETALLAIQTLLAATDWLKDYTMVSYWPPGEEECSEF